MLSLFATASLSTRKAQIASQTSQLKAIYVIELQNCTYYEI